MTEFHHWAEKDHAWKESGVMTQVEVGTLSQSNDENNVIAEKIGLKYRSHVSGLNNNY